MEKINDKEYYELRKELRKLYDNDVNLEGDLCCSILQIRDKYTYVNSINVSLQSYQISVDMDEDTKQEDVINISDLILEKLREFIIKNSTILNIKDKNVFDGFIATNSFCDVIIVGTSIRFLL